MKKNAQTAAAAAPVAPTSAPLPETAQPPAAAAGTETPTTRTTAPALKWNRDKANALISILSNQKPAGVETWTFDHLIPAVATHPLFAEDAANGRDANNPYGAIRMENLRLRISKINKILKADHDKAIAEGRVGKVLRATGKPRLPLVKQGLTTGTGKPRGMQLSVDDLDSDLFADAPAVEAVAPTA